MSKRHRPDDAPIGPFASFVAPKGSGDDIHRRADEARQTKRAKPSEPTTAPIRSALPWDADASPARVRLRCERISWAANLTEVLLSSDPLLIKLQSAANFVQEDAARSGGRRIHLTHLIEVSNIAAVRVFGATGKGSLLHLLIEHFAESLSITPTFTEQHMKEACAAIESMTPPLCRLIRASYDPTLKQPDGKDALALLVRDVRPKAASGWAYYLIEALLDCGASVDTRFHGGRTPLIEWASWSNESHCTFGFLLLLARSADIDARDGSGKTAAHWLAEGGHSGILNGLLEAGWLLAADLTLLNNEGETPLQTAQRQLAADSANGKRRVTCDLLRAATALWAEEVRPLIHRWLSHSLLVPDLAHVVLSFVDGKERGQ